MTAQNSAAKSSAFYKFLPYFRYKMRYLRPQFIMSCIFALLTYPVVGATLYPMCSTNAQIEQLRAQGMMTDLLEEQMSHKMEQIQSLFISAVVIGVLCLIGLFVFTFVTTLRSFRYLYDKTYVDMDMSLPVNHNTRFFGDLAAVAVTNLLPHLIAILVGIVMFSTSGFGEVLKSSYSDLAMYETVFTLVVQCMFTGLYSCIMQVGLCLLMLSFCGRKAEAFIYPVLVNIAVPLIHGLAVNLVQSGIYGVTDVSAPSEMFSMSFTSPLGMLFMTIYSGVASVEIMGGGEPQNMPMFTPAYAVPALVLTLAFFAGAYFLIKNRRSERVGMSYVYSGMDLIIPGVLVFAITLPFSSYIFKLMNGYGKTLGYSYSPSVTSMVIWLVVLSFIAYVIMALISGRNFRRFHITLAKWAGTLAVSVGISAVLAFSNGFGMSYYIPDESNIAKVTVNMSAYVGYDGPTDYHVYSGDPELIRTALEIHRDIPKYDQGERTTSVVSLTYFMKNGECVRRSYRVTDEQFTDYMRRVCTPDLWYLQLTSSLNDLSGEPDKWQCSIRGENTPTAYSGFTLKELLSAMKADCQKVSFEMLADTSGVYEYNPVLSLVNGVNDCSRTLSVYSWMDNTIELFRKCGLDLVQTSVAENYKTAFIVDCESGDMYSTNSYEAMFGFSEGMTAQQIADYMSKINGYDEFGYDVFSADEFTPAATFGCAPAGDSGVEKLISVGSSIFSTSESRYALILSTAGSLEEYVASDGSVMFIKIPHAYDDLAEQTLRKYVVCSVERSPADEAFPVEAA